MQENECPFLNQELKPHIPDVYAQIYRMQNRDQRMPLSQMWYYPLQTYGGRRHVFSSHRQRAHFLTGAIVPVSHPITHHEWSLDLVADAHSCKECDHYQLQQPANLPYFPPSSMRHRLYWCCCPHQCRWKLKTPQNTPVCDAAFIAATQPHGVCGPGDWYKRWGTLSSTAALQPIVYIIICD